MRQVLVLMFLCLAALTSICNALEVQNHHENSKLKEKILKELIKHDIIKSDPEDEEDKNRTYVRIFVGFIVALTLAALAHFFYRQKHPRNLKQDYERFDLVSWNNDQGLDETKKNNLNQYCYVQSSNDHQRQSQTYAKAIKDLEAYLDYDCHDKQPSLVL